jgi:hypothetical protein
VARVAHVLKPRSARGFLKNPRPRRPDAADRAADRRAVASRRLRARRLGCVQRGRALAAGLSVSARAGFADGDVAVRRLASEGCVHRPIPAATKTGRGRRRRGATAIRSDTASAGRGSARRTGRSRSRRATAPR